MSRQTAILNYNSLLGESAISINNNKKRWKETAMSIGFSPSNINKDEVKFIKQTTLQYNFLVMSLCWKASNQ